MVRRIVAQFDAVNGPFLQKLRAIDRRLDGWERNSTASLARVERGVDAVVASAARLSVVSSVVASGFGAGIATRFLDDAKLIRNALREAGDASQETFEEVFRGSVRALTGFKDFTQNVQRFQKALAGQQGLDETIRQVETLNKLLGLSGKTTQERQATTIQFSQALQAGVLQGEELRSLRENAPIELTRAIAAEAGGTIQDLKALAKEGKLTTDVMVRALKRLEEEADQRFGSIQVTIQEAGAVFTSGAIVAVEGLDNGLGASDAFITVLSGLGQVLGESGEAFERFGEAARIAGAVLLASFIGRRVDGFSNSMRSLAQARLEDVAAAEKQVTANARALATARQARAEAFASLTNLERTGAATTRVEKAKQRLIRTDQRLTKALAASRAGHDALSAAQARLLFSTRALSVAGRAMRGAFAFIGGWPGLLLTAAAVFATIQSRVESTAEAVDRLTQGNATVESQLASTTALVEALRQAEKERADGAIEASDRIIAATRNEYEVRRQQLKITNDEILAAQFERIEQMEALAEEEARILARIQREEFRRDQLVSEGEFINSRQIADSNIRLGELADQLGTVEGQTQRLEAAFGEADLQLTELAEALTITFGELEDASQVSAAQDILRKFVDSNTTALERQEARISQVKAARDTLIAAEKDNIITQETLERGLAGVDEAMARFTEEMAGTKREADGLTGSVETLSRALDAISNRSLNTQDRLASARARLAALQGGASEGEANAEGLASQEAARVARAGGTAQEVDLVYQETLKLNLELAETEDRISAILNPDTKRGAGGGGQSTLQKIEEEATRFIASMRTEEERRAIQLAEIVRLRQQLLSIYGQETAMTRDLSEAIRRMQDETSLATMAAETLGDALATGLSQAIAEGERFEDVMRRVIARLIEAEGVDFFTTLLGGSTGGNSLGALAADWITSSVFHKGTDNVGSGGMTRRMPAWAFAGAPRFHDGLFKPGEYPAILERGEQVIPAGMSIGGGPSVSIHNHNDFTGAQAAAVAQLEAAVMRLEAAIPGMALDAVRQAGRTRTKL